MTTLAMEARKEKARQLRYRKPLIRNCSLDFIRDELCEMSEVIDEVVWCENNTELLESMLGDEDDATEFRMAFSDLNYEVERLQEELREVYVPQVYDEVFVSVFGSAAKEQGGMYGWDSYEGDYLPIDSSDIYAEDVANKRIMKLTKEEIIKETAICFRIFASFLALQKRFDELSAAMDVLRGANREHYAAVKQMEQLYEDASESGSWSKASWEFDRLADKLPAEAWIQ